MRFLVDAQLPPALARWLEERGHEAVHVAAIGVADASDAVIAVRAEADAEVLVSKDEGFVTPRLSDSLALLRLGWGNAPNGVLAAWLAPRWGEIERLL